MFLKLNFTLKATRSGNSSDFFDFSPLVGQNISTLTYVGTEDKRNKMWSEKERGHGKFRLLVI